MNSLELESSSEDENDVYVNAVACLKALRTKMIKNDEKLQNNEIEQSKTKPIPKVQKNQSRTRGRKKPRSSEDSYVTYDLTEDLESVSVQDNSEIIFIPDEDVICTRARKKNRQKANDSIILNCSDKTEEDLEIDENFDKDFICTRARKKKQKKANDSIILNCSDKTEEDLEIYENFDKDFICTRARKKNQKKANDSIILNCSEKTEEDLEKDENFDVSVKIFWRSKVIHRLNIYKHENFRKVFQYFVDMENVPIEQILIMKNDKRINLTDTPSSLGLSIIDILEGGIIDANLISPNDYQNQQNNIDEDICQIKVQTANKKSLVIPLRKNQPFQIIIANCAREWSVNKSEIKLYFDGDLINDSDTPESLDLEQEACIDFRIAKK